jgi:hypothetical protein
MEVLFRKIFNESRIKAYRHASAEEISSVVQHIKDAIKSRKVHLVQREKNMRFLNKEHISIEGAYKVIDRFLVEKSFIGIVEDRNNDNGELYIFSIMVPIKVGQKTKNKYIYTKFKLDKNGFVEIISFHDQNEAMHADYRNAVDEKDDYLKHLAWKWKKRLDNVLPHRVKSYYSDSERLYFVFDNLDDYEEIKDLVAREIPFEFGYKTYVVKKNMKKVKNNEIEIELSYD